MQFISDEIFSEKIAAALDELPKEHMHYLDNVAITYNDFATEYQLKKAGVAHPMMLLGLYEGIPKTRRGSSYSLVLPDKITVFKLPILRISNTESELNENIKRTVWHEIAHHFGLDHERIHKVEGSH